MIDMKYPRAKSKEFNLGSMDTLRHGISDNMVLVGYQGGLSDNQYAEHWK